MGRKCACTCAKMIQYSQKMPQASFLEMSSIVEQIVVTIAPCCSGDMVTYINPDSLCCFGDRLVKRDRKNMTPVVRVVDLPCTYSGIVGQSGWQ
ncbi:hypothetical protein DPEC_G00119140 [Dallia pectoralis]|uniref:Uncharacterized protein n=1 Tax=Dallia pectoralis TaxID=75939 RepID=A0ACC2GPK6_DALPE|nr:hypothetical protein DPEC_G00119140 [Dallia pectoralis]